MRRPVGKRGALLLFVAVGVSALFGACGGSSDSNPAFRSPHVLASLPEGKLFANGALVSLQDYRRETFAVVGNHGTNVAPTEGTLSPDGKYMAYLDGSAVLSTTPRVPTAVVIRRTDGRETHRLPVSTTAVSNLAWSPSGDMLVFQVDQSVYIVAGETGDKRSYDVPPGAWGVTWLSGTSSLFFVAGKGVRPANDRTRFYSMDASSGAWSELLLPSGAYPHYSPDGKYYTYSAGDTCFSQCDLWVAETAGTRSPCLIMKNAPANQHPQVPRWSPDSRWLTYLSNADFHAVGTGELHVYDAVNCEDQASLRDVLESIWSPDGHSLALTTKNAPDYNQHLLLWHPGSAMQPLDIVVSSLVWSPDSTSLAVLTADGVAFVNASSGVAANVALSDASGSSLFWSPSSRYIAICRSSSASVAGVPAQLIPASKQGVPTEKQGLPKVTPSPAATRIDVLDRQTSKITDLVDESYEYRCIAWAP